MKLYATLFIFIIHSSSLYAYDHAAQTDEKKQTVVNVHVHTANQASLNQSNSSHQNAHHTSIPQTSVTTISKNEPSLQDQLHDYYQEIQDSSASFVTMIQHNKIKAVAMGCACLYSSIAYQIYRTNSSLNDQNSWSNWRHNMSIEDLFASSQSSLEADLLFAIQTRYVHPTNPTDFIYSIVQASNRLQEEMIRLEEQITRYQWLEKCRCMTIFFLEPQGLLQLQEKHKKLAFIKHIFASWCANYKIEKNS